MPPDLPSGYYLLVAVGLCFGLQNKVPWLHGKAAGFDRMLACSYCTGFHCGWLSRLFHQLIESPPVPKDAPQFFVASVALLSWCIACAWVCYALDSLAKWLEVPYGR